MWSGSCVFFPEMSSYDPSQWYSYSKNRPNEIPSKKILVETDKFVEQPDSSTLVDVKASGASSGDANKKEEQVLDQTEQDTSGYNETAPTQSNNNKMNSFVKRLQKMVRELPRLEYDASKTS